MGKPLDLRGFLEILRRHLVIICIAAALGLLAGAGYVALNPPVYVSTALVVLPSSTSNTPAEVAVASSDPVLRSSLSRIRPAVSLQTLRRRVQVTNLTTDVISVTGQGRAEAQAEDTANAVAASYVAYVGSASSPLGRVPAQVLVAATSATAPLLVVRMLAAGLLGLVLGTAISVIAALAIGRGDRRLRQRDGIADAIGVPVLASVSMGKPAGAVGWTRLLESYEPSAADAWRLRSVLNDLKLTDAGESCAGSAVTVLSLDSDPRALALGPQLAAFAASLGLPTVLAIGPHQGTDAGVALRAAAVASPAHLRAGRLRLAVRDGGGNEAGRQEGVLTVQVAVVNGRSRRAAFPRPDPTVLAVSAGEVTAAQLARGAVSTAVDGARLAGILVGDPDPDDPTTGRRPQLARPNQPKMPSRLTAKPRYPNQPQGDALHV